MNYKEKYEDILFRVGGAGRIGDVLKKAKDLDVYIDTKNLVRMWRHPELSLGELIDKSGYNKERKLKSEYVVGLLRYIGNLFDKSWGEEWDKHEDMIEE